jgi:hypothetical protein
MAVARNKVEPELAGDKLRYDAREGGAVYVITGRYINPTTGFEPVVKVSKATCQISEVAWQ